MKQHSISPDSVPVVTNLRAIGTAHPGVFGQRAAKLAKLMELGLPLPEGFALSFECVRCLGQGEKLPADLPFEAVPGRFLALRSSPQRRSFGGISVLMNIGLCEKALEFLEKRSGLFQALVLYRAFICDFARLVHALDPEDLETNPAPEDDITLLRSHIDEMLDRFTDEVGSPFPQVPSEQLELAAQAMARMWNTGSARILRKAKGGSEDAGLGLVVQDMVLPRGSGLANGRGSYQAVDPATGAPSVTGLFYPVSTQASGDGNAIPLAAGDNDTRTSLNDICSQALTDLAAASGSVSQGLGDAFLLDFALSNGELSILDAKLVQRSARTAVRIAVDLANSGAISRSRALLQIEPRSLIEHLHPHISPAAERDIFGIGIAASPGAASGRLVFTAEAAIASAARDEAAILVRMETGPEDIRGMHSAAGVLTIHGGNNSHAALIARGIGLPCVVGASELRLDSADRSLMSSDGKKLQEGALITLDGTLGQVILGAPEMIAPELGGALEQLLTWADDVRELGVMANADTPADALTARRFRVDGIGLCRTEHMFFDESRVGIMREMILANEGEVRQAAVNRLLPMQRADFAEIFRTMRGLPVTIRLLDPPLHEFLPSDSEEISEFASSAGLPLEHVTERVRDLSEVNPMLGMRGVRLGIAMPEIYGMQARAIFEAAIEVSRETGVPVVPEVMIPLVSAHREVELVKERVDAIAVAVCAEQQAEQDYRLGAIVETPRAALRSGDLATSTSFLSFGTNDLTQMTYGLSRDDAGRFMRGYVNQGVFAEDPFHSLDIEGVGELMLIAARRGRASNPALVLGLCGEHGGDPASVRFCKVAGFDYVSCSPYRVPIARLAAAQATLLADDGDIPE